MIIITSQSTQKRQKQLKKSIHGKKRKMEKKRKKTLSKLGIEGIFLKLVKASTKYL